MRFNLDYFLDFLFSPSSAMLKGIVLTVSIAIVSQFFGTLFGALMATAALSRHAFVRALVHIYVGFWRGSPVLVQLVLVYFGLSYVIGFDLFPPSVGLLGISLPGAVLAGTLTFIFHETAFMSEIVRAGILSIDSGQWEAAQSLGMSPSLTMRRIIFPQAIRVIVPPLGNQFNMMLKTTSLLSVIAVSEMFRISQQMVSATYRTFEIYLGVAIYYIALTAVATVLQKYFERRIAKGYVTVTSKRNALKTVEVAEG